MDDENLDDLEQPKKSSLDLKQKIAVPVLGIFALVLIVLWASDLNSTIKNSLNSSGENSSEEVLNNIGDTCPDGNCGEAERTNVDSDNDGLLDWEEIEKYGTSPYLEDTDGDGYTDKEEVDKNYDPNCPVGEDCYGQTINEEEAENNQENVESDLNAEASSNLNTENLNLNDLNSGNLNTDNLDIESSNVEGIVSGGASPSELREMLKQAGMDEAMLNAVSDEALMQAYQETLSQN